MLSVYSNSFNLCNSITNFTYITNDIKRIYSRPLIEDEPKVKREKNLHGIT
jgi:hypothetical protein